jgi:hypothetical protein
VSLLPGGPSPKRNTLVSIPPGRKSISNLSMCQPSPSTNHRRFAAGSAQAAKTFSGAAS